MLTDPTFNIASYAGLLALLIAAYLAGSLPSAWLMGKLIRGIDLRQHGSGNLGTTNAMRVLGRGPGLIVLLLDIGKAVLAILVIAPLLTLLPPGAQPWPSMDLMRIACASLAVAGHAFPVWLGFRGGKAVATGAAAATCLAPLCAPICLIWFIAVLVISRRVSLASMTAALALPAVYALIYQGPEFSGPLQLFFILSGLLVILLHRKNIRRLLAGQEPPFRFKS